MAKNEQPFFSIIIPCLNEEKFIPLLLHDLASQTFKNFETIVVDGNSEDETQNKVKQYSNVKLLITNKRNVSHQRNQGAIMATGKYLLFFDADNRLPINFCHDLWKQLNKNQIGICSTKTAIRSNIFIDQLVVLSGNILVKISAFFKRPLFAGACICVDTKLFQVHGGFNEQLTLSEDHEFAYRYVRKGVSCRFFSNPKYYFSLRRFKRDGYPKVLFQWFLGLMADLTKIDQIAKNASYKMGGGKYKTSEF